MLAERDRVLVVREDGGDSLRTLRTDVVVLARADLSREQRHRVIQYPLIFFSVRQIPPALLCDDQQREHWYGKYSRDHAAEKQNLSFIQMVTNRLRSYRRRQTPGTLRIPPRSIRS